MTVRSETPGTTTAHSGRGLQRGLRILGTLLITLSAITPASSVFIIIPIVFSLAGTGSFWAFVIAAIVGVFMAFVYAELSSAYPVSGGEYAVIGRTVGGGLGFIIMGLSIVTLVLIIAVIALGVGTYLGVLFDGLNGPVVAAAAVIVATVVAIFDIKFNAVVTGVFLAIEMLALLALVLLGFLHVERPFTELLFNPVMLSDGALAPVGFNTIMIATSVAIFAYNGYGAALFFGEETHDAHRGIAKAILWALAITVASELIPVVAVLLGAPDLTALFGAPQMMEYFVIARGGDTLNTLVSLGIAIAVFNAVIAIILQASRLVFSSGRDAAWPKPISEALAATHGRYRTPWIATILVGIASAAACFIDIQKLSLITGTSLIVVYAGLCLGVIMGRRNGSTSHAAYRMPLYPLPPIAALVVMGYITYINATDPTFGQPSLMWTIGIIVVSAIYYFAVIRPRGKWVLRGPEDDDGRATG